MNKDNKGLSLVELLVAIAIAAIVSSSIAFLLRTSLSFFGNETTDVALQQELQITLNQIMDYAMETQEVVISGSSTETNFVALGSIIPKVSESEPAKFDAKIIWKDDNKLYLKKEIIENVTKEIEDETLSATINSKISAVSSTKENYLLAEYVDKFLVAPNGIVAGTTTYENPISLDINIEFKKKVTAKEVVKKVSDKAVLRNRLKLPIFVNGNKYTLKKNSSKLEITTETVKNDVALFGDIRYVRSGSSSRKSKLTVIEVIPNPAYSMIGYLIGGKEPIDSDGIDACANAVIGPYINSLQENGSSGSMKQNAQFLTNNIASGGSTIPNFYIGSGMYNGYFEKVSSSDRKGRGGVYAINKSSSSFDDISFVSEYSVNNYNDYSRDDFCWVWREENGNPEKGILYKGNTSPITDFNLSDIRAALPESKIYVHNCKKYKVVNNEIFILYCLGYDTTSGMYGLCQGMGPDGNPEYNFSNNQEIRNFDKSKIELLSYTPQELATHQTELSRADLIYFISEKGNYFNLVENLLRVESPNSVANPSNPFSYTGDISFDNMKYIYNEVINYRMGIIVSKPTYEAVTSSVNNVVQKNKNENKIWKNQDDPLLKNLNNLFFMLYGMKNENIVTDGERVYGENTNRYYIKNEEKVAELKSTKGEDAYRWSGRVMFSDFFKSNNDNQTAFSYENYKSGNVLSDGKRSYYFASDFIHYKESASDSNQSGLIGDIVLGPVYEYSTYGWWRDNTYKTWTGQVIDNNGDFSIARDRENRKILNFVLKNYYYDQLGFRYASPNTGVFVNQALVETEKVFKYNPWDSNGNVGFIGNVVSCTKGVMSNSTHDDDAIGTIELVGYAVGKDVYGGSTTRDNGRYNLPSNHEELTYEDCLAGDPTTGRPPMYYQHDFESLPNNKGKGLYLSHEELELAKENDNGVFIYMLIRSSEDFYPVLSNENEFNPYMYYPPHQDPNSTETPPAPLPCEIYTEYEGEAVKYKGGVNPKERYVTEFRAHIPALYFNGNYTSMFGQFFPPTNYGNNKMIARLGISEGESIPFLVFPKTKEIEGQETFYICVRDLFDLD